jgi:hypothetical protein
MILQSACQLASRGRRKNHLPNVQIGPPNALSSRVRFPDGETVFLSFSNDNVYRYTFCGCCTIEKYRFLLQRPDSEVYVGNPELPAPSRAFADEASRRRRRGN